ncbi:MAG: DUF2306 domain-containing protein [Anaerolineales bacterium]|nr:DUF2306 domain-containing protein [Anaerolineales bacterium]
MNKNLGKKALWGLMAFLATGVALYAAIVYGGRNTDFYFPQQRLTYLAHMSGILTHALASSVALLIGPFQFLPRLRQKRFLSLHRWLGRIYLLGILLGGLSGFYMARLAHGGFPAQVGFSLLAVLWLFTGAMAYQRIRTGNVRAHEQWMIRNYALTFAAVTLRLYLGLGQAFLPEVEFTAVYITTAWLCWIPNLLIAEILINYELRIMNYEAPFLMHNS